jgi:hypothetical protein
MRREWVLLMFAAMVVVAVAAASVAAASRPPAEPARDSTAAPVAVQRVGIPATGLRDEAAMVLVGSALIGLAAAVRRAA